MELSEVLGGSAPLEFRVMGRPVSQQARRARRREEWKVFIRQSAQRFWEPKRAPCDGPIAIEIVYLWDDLALDADNIIKPIQDALKGLAFEDDAQITDISVHKRALQGTFDLAGVSPILADGFGLGDAFIYVRVADAPPQERLT